MRRQPFALGVALLGAATAGLAVAGGAAAHAGATLADVASDWVDTRRGKGQRNRRGKGAARRHGAKLRSNMHHVSKRVRRKHRRG